MPKRTKKYVAAEKLVHTLRASGSAYLIVNQETDIYDHLEASGYWWDSDNGEWKKRDFHQNTRGGYSTEPGVYRLRVMCHQLDVERVCKKLATEHRVIDMSNPYPNDRKGNPEIVRVYFTCILPE